MERGGAWSVAGGRPSSGRGMTGRRDAFVGARAYAGERLAPRPLAEGGRRSLGELGYGPGQGR